MPNAIYVKNPITQPVYEEGNEYTGITGGWDSNAAVTAIPITKNVDNFQCTASNVQDAVAQTVNKVDVSRYDKIVFDYETITADEPVDIYVQLRNNRDERIVTFPAVFSKAVDKTIGRQTVEITESGGIKLEDVKGEYYIYMGVTADTSGSIDVKIYNARLVQSWQRVKNIRHKDSAFVKSHYVSHKNSSGDFERVTI